MVRTRFVNLVFFLLWAGCSKQPTEIPAIPKDHPAHQFYAHASVSMVSDKVCRDFKGSTEIPMGEVVKGEAYVKSAELAPGVFRFYEKKTGKRYLGVSYLTWHGFLMLPELCVWED